MVRLNILLFVCSLAVLFFILRYRIHVHITYQPRSSRRPSRIQRREPAGWPHPAISGEAAKQGPSAVKAVDDLTEALLGLGMKSRTKARRIAEKAVSRGGAFDEQLRYAVREAA